jgi:hypothetical protein
MRGHSYRESDSRHQRCGKLDHVATTVYVVTAGREATYRIERIYLTQDEAQDFADRYNAMQPVEFLHVESWETGAPTAVYDGPYWVARWTARMPEAKRPSESRDAPRDRYGDFEVKREWWTGGAVPEVQVVRHEISGMPHVEVIGLSKQKVEQALYDTVVAIREQLEGIKLSPRQSP